MTKPEILLISRNENQLQRLKKLVNRKEIHIIVNTSPENGLFTILNQTVSAVLIDTVGLELQLEEFLLNLQSLDLHLEILLICDRNQHNIIPIKQLRACYAILSPELREQQDFLCINQLIEKMVLKAQLRSLKDSSISDGLTGLLNHAFIQKTLEEEVDAAKTHQFRLSMIFLDIDHFKNFNDTNGHPEGDVVLKKVASLIKKSVRKIDFAARYGGEEFIVLLPGTGLVTALSIAERIRSAIAEHKFRFGEKQPMGYVSASFGVASLEHPHIESKKSLLFHADQALYCAKDKGRNQVWFAFKGKYQPNK